MHALNVVRKHIEPRVGRIDTRVRRSLWDAVAALLICGRLTLSTLGRALPRRTSAKHRLKAVDRLLGNGRLRASLPQLAAALVSWIGPRDGRLVILIDWTQLDVRHHALIAAVPVCGRALVILAEAHPEVMLGNPSVQRRFLKTLRKILPVSAQPVIITDAGFQTPWILDVKAMGWSYIARMRKQTCIRLHRNPAWQSNKALHACATSTPRDLGLADFPKKKKAVCARLVIVNRPRRGRVKRGKLGRPLSRTQTKKHHEREREPWLLATNLDLRAERIVKLYAARMQIEETFRSAKSPRFGWSLRHARTHSRERWEILLAIAMVAMAVALVTGLAAERNNRHRGLQANTTRRRVLSLVTLGCMILFDRDLSPKPPEIRHAIHDLRRLTGI